MRRLAIRAVLAGACAFAAAPGARAGTPSVDAGAPVSRARGLALLARAGNADAWTLARGIYARPALRPSEIDDAHARVLAGEPPAEAAPKDLTDLAETCAAIKGDDAPSRALLASLATTFHVRGIVVFVTSSDLPPYARLFLAETGAFDAARYVAERADGGDADWSAAIASLDRTYGVVTAPSSPRAEWAAAPTLATRDVPAGKETGGSRPFYASPWFWGAIGAAALGGTALYFATRDNSPSSIHLQLQVPK